NIIPWSFRTAPLVGDNRNWLDEWTLFYWSWWIAWAPFVGMFIARVSRGRTIRQFIIGVVIAPTLLISIWFAVFGSTAGYVQYTRTDLTHYSSVLVLFYIFDQLPLSIHLSIIALVLLMIFFINSADSATLVCGMQSIRGSFSSPKSVNSALGLVQSA